MIYPSGGLILNPLKALQDLQNVVKVDHIQFPTDIESNPTQVGALFWDSHDKTLSIVLDEGTKAVVLQIGQELFVRAVNKTGDTLTNGTVVYISGAQGSRPTISPATASSYSTSRKVIGVITTDIANNAEGNITLIGVVRDLDTSMYVEGTQLYLAETAGGYTSTRPSIGIARICVATVIKSHPTDGWISVKIAEDKYMFGDPDEGNFSAFHDDGSLVAYGDAKYTLDEFGILIGKRITSPSSKIQQNDVEGTLDFADDCTLADYVTLMMQINHDWDQVTLPEVHGHWWQNQASIPNMLIGWRWQVNGQPKVTDFTYAKYNEQKFEYLSGTLLQISDFPAIPIPDPIGVSSILHLRFFRDTNNDSGLFSGTDPVTGDISALFVDAHKRVDMKGSRQEYLK